MVTSSSRNHGARNSGKSRWFLGTNFGHDAAVALINGKGELVFALEEGRVTSEKNCSRFPVNAIASALKITEGGDLVWGEGWHWPKRLLHKGIAATIQYGFREPLLLRVRLRKELLRFGRSIYFTVRYRRKLGTPVFTGHHLAHALSLVPCDLPKSTVVLVSDTTGEQDSLSAYYWDGKCMTLLNRSPWPNSPGTIFHQAAYFAGFPGERGPGKLMALSAYGKPHEFTQLHNATSVRSGRFRVDTALYPAFRYTDAIERTLSSEPAASRCRLARARHAEANASDFAATMQHWFEDILRRLVDDTCETARNAGLQVHAVGLSGGAALNCQANGRLANHLVHQGIEKLVVSPWSSDAGTAVGAAVHVALRAGVTKFRATTPLLGPRHEDAREATDDDVSDAADAILRGEIVALVSGGVEFGPRALGGRALLADARRADAVERLNHVKGRPAFMPFAPVARAEECHRWFAGTPSADMAWTVNVKDGAATAFPGIRHPSGEARVQAAVRERCPLLYRLLQQCEKRGMPMLLLTSLNGAGEPMLANVRSSIMTARVLGAAGCLTDKGWTVFDD